MGVKQFANNQHSASMAEPPQGSIAKRLAPGLCLGEADEQEVKRRRLTLGDQPLSTPEGTAALRTLNLRDIQVLLREGRADGS